MCGVFACRYRAHQAPLRPRRDDSDGPRCSVAPRSMTCAEEDAIPGQAVEHDAVLTTSDERTVEGAKVLAPVNVGADFQVN